MLGACASAPPIAPAGDGAFFITRQAATGLSGIGDLRAEALREASAHCTSLGKGFTVVNSQQTEGPYGFGRWPRVDITFRCT